MERTWTAIYAKSWGRKESNTVWKRHQRNFQLACLGSGMKWFRKDIGEYLKEVANWWKNKILSTSKETFDFEIATNKFIGRCELFPAHHDWGSREKYSNDIKSKHIFINLTITFVNIKMFIFQPLLLKNKNILDPHDFKTLFVTA